jgi:hypothetical protein
LSVVLVGFGVEPGPPVGATGACTDNEAGLSEVTAAFPRATGVDPKAIG